MSVYIYPPLQTSVSSAPIEYVRNGASTPVRDDTTTPANIRPLPVKQVDDSGNVLDNTLLAKEAKQDSLILGVAAVVTELEKKADLGETQPVSVASLPLPIGAATEAKQDSEISKLTDIDIKIGTGNSTLTSIDGKDFATQATLSALNAKFNSLGQKSSANSAPVVLSTDQGNKLTDIRNSLSKIEDTVNVSNEIEVRLSNLNGAATTAKQDDIISRIGNTNETAPVDDTSASGLNGRLQRIAQRITSLIALLPVSLGQKVKADSLAVTIASDQDTLPIEQVTKSGTVSSAKITVGTSAIRATVDGNAPSAARKKLLIKPTIGNSGAIYLGGSGVTTSNGLQIVGPDRLEFELDSSDYYLISDTAAQSVEVLEVI
jgi:hypothetical protein